MENHIRPRLGTKIISQVTPKDIQRLYDKLAQSGNLRTGVGLSGGTIYGIHGMLHEALQAAQQAHLIASNPTAQVTVPKFAYGPKQILTKEQLDVFMKVIEEDEIWCDFFYTELTTGLRQGELYGLKWEDFDEVSCTLKICRIVYRESCGGLTTRDTKTSAGTRKIVLPPWKKG